MDYLMVIVLIVVAVFYIVYSAILNKQIKNKRKKIENMLKDALKKFKS